MSAPPKRIRLLKNSPNTGDPRLFLVPQTLNDLLTNGGQKLGLQSVQYAYTSGGGLVEDLSLLREDEEVYLSETPGFYKNQSSPSSSLSPKSSSQPSSPRNTLQSSATGVDTKSRPYRIAVLGRGGVGKSRLTIRYVRRIFVESYDPTIEDAFRHQTVVDNVVSVLDILDTAGQEDFRCLAQQWAEKRDGFILVYSTVDRRSFSDITSFYDLICATYLPKSLVVPPTILVANKTDLHNERTVSTAEGEALAKSWGSENFTFIETSAKTGDNVNKTFETLIRKMRHTQPPPAKRKSFCMLL